MLSPETTLRQQLLKFQNYNKMLSPETTLRQQLLKLQNHKKMLSLETTWRQQLLKLQNHKKMLSPETTWRQQFLQLKTSITMLSPETTFGARRDNKFGEKRRNKLQTTKLSLKTTFVVLSFFWRSTSVLAQKLANIKCFLVSVFAKICFFPPKKGSRQQQFSHETPFVF